MDLETFVFILSIFLVVANVDDPSLYQAELSGSETGERKAYEILEKDFQELLQG